MNNKKKEQSKLFKLLVGLGILTFLLPIALAALQVIFTYHKLSLDLSSSANWFNATSTFSLAIELFKILIAATGFVGIYYKIYQTERQIKQVENKDNFSIFIQHREYVINALKEQLTTIESKDNYFSHPSTFYITLFPENTPKKVINFDFTSAVPPFEFPNFLFAIRSINHSIKIKKEKITERYVEEMINKIQKDFKSFGFRFKAEKHSTRELSLVIKAASDLLDVINYFAPISSQALETNLSDYKSVALDELLSPYDKEVY